MSFFPVTIQTTTTSLCKIGNIPFRGLGFVDYDIIHGKSQSVPSKAGTEFFNVRHTDSFHGEQVVSLQWLCFLAKPTLGYQIVIFPLEHYQNMGKQQMIAFWQQTKKDQH